ncbi:hypothetical protein BBO99_00005317, partial [Phytophthora kernoviae]
METDPADEVGEVFEGAPTKKTIHVLVVVPGGATGSALSQPANSAALQNIA